MRGSSEVQAVFHAASGGNPRPPLSTSEAGYRADSDTLGLFSTLCLLLAASRILCQRGVSTLHIQRPDADLQGRTLTQTQIVNGLTQVVMGW